MATITTRAGKGSPLTNTEVDANFTNLNTEATAAYGWGNHASAGYITSDANTTYTGGTGITLSGTTFNLTDTNAKLNLTGGTVSGDIAFGDNDKATFGAGGDLSIYHDGSNGRIRNSVGTLKIQATSNGENGIELTPDGKTALFHNGVEKIATTSTGIDVTGQMQADSAYITGSLTFPDGQKIKMGASEDLQIYHDGSNSVIREVGTGALEIQTNGAEIQLTGNAGTDYMLRAISNGAVKLYYDNSTKLATTSAGVNVTGTVTATGGNSTNWNTAYGWGNHASGGYLAASHDMTVTLTGDVTGTAVHTNMGTATISTVVADDSHNHTTLHATDNRTISPSELSASKLRFGFTSWANNNTSPYADYLHFRTYADSSGGKDNLLMFKKSSKGMRLWQQTFGSATAYSSYVDIWDTGTLTTTNKANYDTAYGWGDHGTQSYATQSYVGTQISNLVDSSPAALNTLNELAAALGDDPNFATTVTNSIATKLPLAGGTMTGAINTNGSNIVVASGTGLSTTGTETRFTTAHGYIQLGPMNTSYAHIYTNISGGFYFNNTNLYANGNHIWHAGDFANNSTNWNTAYTVANAAAPKAGATFTGQVNVNYSASKFVVGGTTVTDTSDANRPNITLKGGVYPHMTIDSRNAANTGTNTNHGPVFSFVQRLSTSGYRRFSIGTAGYNGDRLSFGYADNNANPHYGMGTDGTGAMMYLTTGAQLIVNSSVSTPIVYDKDNTAYYVNPASTSVQSAIDAASYVKAANVSITSGDANGIGFWDGTTGGSGSYAIYMSSQGGSYAGRVTGDTTSDYNMYFKMSAGTNRGFVFKNGASSVAGIDGAGNGRFDGTISSGDADIRGALKVNIGTTSYTSHTNVDEYVARFVTDYNASGSQSLNIVNHNGNWVDGTSGSDSAYGLMWAMENNTRAGIHYDHRGSEKFDIFSGYGPIRFRTPASATASVSPIGSESSMPARLTIEPGGPVIASHSVRSPIYYDNNDTSYFIDSNTTSRLNQLKLMSNVPILFQNTGTGTYNHTEYYHGQNNTSGSAVNGMFIEMGRLTDSGSAEVRQFVVGARGGQTQFRIDGVGNTFSTLSSRAPIFYDSNNSSYFLNPSAQGGNALKTIGDWRQDSGTWSGEVAGKMQYHSNNWYIQYSSEVLFRNSSAVNTMTMASAGHMSVTASMRSPYFYDLDNTGFYANPADLSNFHRMALNPPSSGTLPVLQVNQGSGSHQGIAVDINQANAGYAIDVRGSVGSGQFNVSSAYNSNPIVLTSGSFRAPYFYDSDNTNYYVDAAGKSKLNELSAAGHAVNYATSEDWVVAGQANQQGRYGGDFTVNGDGNSVSWDEAPNTGNNPGRGKIWKTRNNDANSGADGGWNKNITGLNVNKAYMSVVYVRRASSSTNGSFYHGCRGSSTDTHNLSGTGNSNPYFSSFGISTLDVNQWYVSVGIIQAANDSNTANWTMGGLWKLETGARQVGYTTFKMGGSGSGQQDHRTYLYYSTDSAAALDWYAPGFYEINGSEPSIEDLMGRPKDSVDRLTVADDMRAPIYYDSNDTAVFLDPNGTTSLNINGLLSGNSNNTTEIGTYSTGAIKRIRMAQGGEIHFGDTTSGSPLGITEGAWDNFADQDRLSVYYRSSIKFFSAVVQTAQIDGSGNLTTAGNVTAYSDIRLKDDIQPIEDAVSKVQKLKGVTYFRNDNDDENRQAGLIAQDVELVLPEAVREMEDGIKTVNYNATMGLLVEAIKELTNKVEMLEKQLE